MKIKTTLVALTLVLAPTYALAGGDCSGFDNRAQSASVCTEGQTFNETLGMCVTTPTG